MLHWFRSWLEKHLNRHELLGLPEPTDNPALYEGWESELERYRVTEERAEDASRKLLGRKVAAKDHFPAMLTLACQKPTTPGATAPAAEGPDYSKPEALT